MNEPQRPVTRLWWQTGGLLVVGAGIPVVLALLWSRLPASGRLPPAVHGGKHYDPSPALRLNRRPIGPEPTALPRITNVQIVDWEGDGHNEILACDGGRNVLLLYRLQSTGEWEEEVIESDLGAPGHATLVDLDGDGDRDILVALLGNLMPDDGAIGSVLLLENTGGAFRRRILLDDVRRVVDVQPGDLDGDGDIDLAVAEFGYSRGHVLWLENRGSLRFREHELHSAPGTIHVPVVDLDGDGDQDLAAIVTQDEEELWAFESLGGGHFAKHLLQRWFNYDLGGAGLVASDLDSDGDADLIVPVGDNLEDHAPYPQPYHGCFWFENRGGWEFVKHRIAELGGTYAAAVADLNTDGHQDVVLVSMANNWRVAGRPSIVWLENDGEQNFRTWAIDQYPTHLITVACGDLTGNGQPDIVAGGLHLRGPFDRIGRITTWVHPEASQ